MINFLRCHGEKAEQLKAINLYGNGITSSGLGEVLEYIKLHENIQYLNLGGNGNLTNSDGRRLLAFVMDHSHITTVRGIRILIYQLANMPITRSSSTDVAYARH